MTERKDDPYSFNQSGSDTELLISLILVQYTNTYGSIKSFTDSHIKQRFIPTIVYITLLCHVAPASGLSQQIMKVHHRYEDSPPIVGNVIVVLTIRIGSENMMQQSPHKILSFLTRWKDLCQQITLILMGVHIRRTPFTARNSFAHKMVAYTLHFLLQRRLRY